MLRGFSSDWRNDWRKAKLGRGRVEMLVIESLSFGQAFQLEETPSGNHKALEALLCFWKLIRFGECIFQTLRTIFLKD